VLATVVIVFCCCDSWSLWQDHVFFLSFIECLHHWCMY
jgi:hypothetical protein